jgi:hypothetical protein
MGEILADSERVLPRIGTNKIGIVLALNIRVSFLKIKGGNFCVGVNTLFKEQRHYHV